MLARAISKPWTRLCGLIRLEKGQRSEDLGVRVPHFWPLLLEVGILDFATLPLQC